MSDERKVMWLADRWRSAKPVEVPVLWEQPGEVLVDLGYNRELFTNGELVAARVFADYGDAVKALRASMAEELAEHERMAAWLRTQLAAGEVKRLGEGE